MRVRPFLHHRSALGTALLAGSLTLTPSAQAAPGTLRDFRLPPDQAAPTGQPAPQGPVAPDVPASGVLRQAPAPAPTPAPTASPAPEATSTPVIQPLPAPPPEVPLPPSSARPRAAQPSPTLTPQAQPTPPAAAASPEAGSGLTTAAPAGTPRPLPSSTSAAGIAAERPSAPWFWIAGALAALAALGLAAWLVRRRTGPGASAAAPQVERPSLASPDPAATPPSPAPIPSTDEAGLDVELEPVRLSLSLMNATLSYRLLVNNRGAGRLENLSITADMIAAHATLTREQQLCGPDANALQVASIPLLEPGESRCISGEFRLPFGQITPVRRGNAALLFPLARFRVDHGREGPITRTFLVAQPPERPGAGLQPFRLDLGPRIYPRLAQRAFA